MAQDLTGDIIHLGPPLSAANGAVLMLHGRGSSGEDIAQLANSLHGKSVAFLAPSAKGGSWYPQKFLAPKELNQPALDEALRVIDGILDQFRAAGIPAERIGLIGFSQGACLTSEYLSLNPEKLSWVAALSGALMGSMDTWHGGPSLKAVSVLLGCAEADAHIPLAHVEKTAAILAERGAQVEKQIFAGSAHTVFPEEIEWLNEKLNDW